MVWETEAALAVGWTGPRWGMTDTEGGFADLMKARAFVGSVCIRVRQAAMRTLDVALPSFIENAIKALAMVWLGVNGKCGGREVAM